MSSIKPYDSIYLFKGLSIFLIAFLIHILIKCLDFYFSKHLLHHMSPNLIYKYNTKIENGKSKNNTIILLYSILIFLIIYVLNINEPDPVFISSIISLILIFIGNLIINGIANLFITLPLLFELDNFILDDSTS